MQSLPALLLCTSQISNVNEVTQLETHVNILSEDIAFVAALQYHFQTDLGALKNQPRQQATKR